MESLLGLLASGSTLAWVIAAVIVTTVVLVVVMGFVEGREISFWPLKLGTRPPSERWPDRELDGSTTAESTWVENSRTVDERELWLKSSILVVGVQYSPKFFKDFFDVIRARSMNGRTTLALVVRPESAAARYLVETTTGSAAVSNGVSEIERLLKEADEGRGYARLKKHDRVMRYSFIRTEDRIWVKFFTNPSYRTVVPAVRIDRGTVPFEFFERDARQLEEVSVE